jgi:hypothetical protein
VHRSAVHRGLRALHCRRSSHEIYTAGVPLLFTEVMPSLHTTLAATQVTHRFRSPLRGEGAGVGVAWGLAPGAGQLGAAGLGYYGVTNCWSYQLVYDRFGNYLGEQPANICLDLPRD